MICQVALSLILNPTRQKIHTIIHQTLIVSLTHVSFQTLCVVHTKIINYLSHHISTGTCELLLLGSEDPKVLASFIPFDRSHVTKKAIHIADALQALVLKTVSGSSVTWLECCKISVKKITIYQQSTNRC